MYRTPRFKHPLIFAAGCKKARRQQLCDLLNLDGRSPRSSIISRRVRCTTPYRDAHSKTSSADEAALAPPPGFSAAKTGSGEKSRASTPRTHTTSLEMIQETMALRGSGDSKEGIGLLPSRLESARPPSAGPPSATAAAAVRLSKAGASAIRHANLSAASLGAAGGSQRSPSERPPLGLKRADAGCFAGTREEPRTHPTPPLQGSRESPDGSRALRSACPAPSRHSQVAPKPDTERLGEQRAPESMQCHSTKPLYSVLALTP